MASRRTRTSGKIPELPFRHSTGRQSPVEVLRLSELRSRALDHSIHDPTRLDFHLVQFVIRGRGHHYVDFQRIALRTGDVVCVRPGQVHRFDPRARHEAFVLLFRADAVGSAARLRAIATTSGSVLRPRAGDFRILTDLLAVQERLDRQATDLRSGTIGPTVLTSVLVGLDDIATATAPAPSPTTAHHELLVQRFEALVEPRHDTSRPLDWFATRLATTTRTLNRACRAVRSCSPKQLIDMRVLLEAKRRLATTDATAEAIGLDLGFSEATNFVKFFRRLAKATPNDFRKRQVPRNELEG